MGRSSGFTASSPGHLSASEPPNRAECTPKGWGQQKPGAGGWDIVHKLVSPTLWRTTQTCLFGCQGVATQLCPTTKLPPGHPPAASSHGGALDVAAMLWDTAALLLTYPRAQGAAEGSSLRQEKVTRIRSMCSCVIKPNIDSSHHHPHHRAGRYLQCSPQHSSHTAGDLSNQEHLSRHTPPRWLHHVPSEHGHRLETRRSIGRDRSNHSPERSVKALSAGTQPYPVTWHMSSFPLLCHNGASSTVMSSMTRCDSLPSSKGWSCSSQVSNTFLAQTPLQTLLQASSGWLKRPISVAFPHLSEATCLLWCRAVAALGSGRLGVRWENVDFARGSTAQEKQSPAW